MKDIKDYLHLYLGCDVTHAGNKTGKLVSVGISGSVIVYPDDDQRGRLIMSEVLKPILRPLSDMTEEEQTESERIYAEMMDKADEEGHICDAEIWAEHSRWLISKGFDVFQLIESGLAIDKTTLK